jgi:hypothetical protein
VAFALTCILAGSGVAVGQTTGLNIPGLTLGTKGGLAVGISGLSLSGVVVTTPTSIGIGRSGISAVLPAVGVSSLITVSPTSIDVSGRGTTVVLSGVSVADLAAVGSTTVSVVGGKATVGLPGVSLAGLSIATTPLGLDLSGQGPLIDAPAVTVGISGLVGATALGQVSPIAQLFADMGSAGVLGPIESLLSGLAFADIATSAPGCAATDSGALAPLPVSNVWMWSASTLRSSEHDGFQVVKAGDGGECGSSLPTLALEQTNLPGMLWDASSALGLKRGTLYLGFTGGPGETDTQIKASAMLRDAGIARAGAVKLTSWSAGAFSLLTSDQWYAASAVGSAWGRTESRDFVLGAASDYDTSTFVAAGLVGTIVPLTDTTRFDLRGTLTYQRTVGEAHIDTLGIVYGDHTIEGANAVVSGRLFGIFQLGDAAIRPFLQAGATHYLHYDNKLAVDGVAFSLDQADTSLFVATGLDFEMSKTLQFSLGVRQDFSGDAEAFAGRFGLSARLN